MDAFSAHENVNQQHNLRISRSGKIKHQVESIQPYDTNQKFYKQYNILWVTITALWQK